MLIIIVGSAAMPAASFAAVERPSSRRPDDARLTFKQRLQQVSDDSDAVISLGAWGLKHDLDNEVFAMYRRFLVEHGFDRPVYDALMRVASRRALPDSSPAMVETHAALGPRFLAYRGDFFILLSDADPAWCRTQLGVLDAAHHQFQRYCRRVGLTPLPLEHRLVSVLFRRFEDYKRFATTHDEVGGTHIAGYYAPRSHRTVFYHPEENPSLTEARRSLEEIAGRISMLRNARDDAHRAGDAHRVEAVSRAIEAYRETLARESTRVETFIERIGVATTIHEATHQLLFQTHVQSPYVQYPLWISEGLATSFETDEAMHAFGPEYDYHARREAFEHLVEQGSLMSLSALVSTTTMQSRSDARASQVYHQSYALITWMNRFRREELVTYLRLLREYRPGKPSNEEHLAIFERAFGPVESVERSWLRAEGATDALVQGAPGADEKQGAGGHGVKSTTVPAE